MMTFSVGDRVLEFRPVALRFAEGLTSNLFVKKNNKTVSQTLRGPKYSHLTEVMLRDHPGSAQRRLGEFLLDLKRAGDALYLRFLNRYGDEAYCEFCLDDPKLLPLIGLYCFMVDGQIKYIGKSTDSYAKRINQGYGRIHPKNCYRDGQATNCHLNALIAKCLARATFVACPLLEATEIESLERILIARERPEWNVQLKAGSTCVA